MRVGRVVDECVNKGAEYADCTSISYKRLRIEYANGQDLVSEDSGSIYVVKVLLKGRWGVSASTKLSDHTITEVLNRAAVSTSKSIRLASRRPAQGGYVIGQKKVISKSFEPDIVELLKSVESGLREVWRDLHSFRGVFEGLIRAKAMISSDGVNAYEIKPLVICNFTAFGKRGEIAEFEVFGSGGLEVLENMDPQKVVEELAFKLNASSKCKMLNPYYRGTKFEAVLSSNAASHVMQVVVESSFNARSWRRLEKSCDDLTIVDDPTLEGGYGSFFFDDEGVRARRKKLMESGKLVSLLHNRETAYEYGVEPTGNGRGFAVPPEPLHSNIIVSPGDWNLEEIIEETKLGFLVYGVRRTSLIDEVLVIEPETTFLLLKGEVREPVKVGYFAVNVREFLSSIKAIASGPLGLAREIILGCEVASYSPPIKVDVRAL